jgi:hypothetical protein
MEYSYAHLVAGQLLFSSDYPGPSTPSDIWPQWDNIYWPNSLPGVVQDGHTLEVRMDLLRASADDVFVVMGVDGGSGGYGVFLDQDELALLKYTANSTAMFCWTHAPVTNQNVTVVLAVTRMTNTVLLTMRVVERGGDRVLYERSFFDGPGRDFEAVTPHPKGMTVWGPDPGGALTSFDLAFVGVFQWATNNPIRLEVVVDNLEYDLYKSAWIAPPSNALLLNWPENTAEEQIVVGAGSVEGPYTPYPEPIFNRLGKVSMAVETTSARQFFKLVPGTQFIDDFSNAKEPFAPRNPWEPWFANGADASRFAFTITNDAFRIEALMPPLDGQLAVFTPGGGAILRDFYASVDILDWASSQESALGIAGRVQGGPGGVSNFYLGSVRMNPSARTGQLWFFDGASDVQASDVFSITPVADYRLESSAVGNQLTLRLFRLAEPRSPSLVAEGTLQDSRFTQGRVALWVNTRGSTGYMRTVDNFFVTGTKP